MKTKKLNYDEFMTLAMKNYTKGGDSYFECWERSDFNEYCDLYGGITESSALEMFRCNYSVERDRYNAYR